MATTTGESTAGKVLTAFLAGMMFGAFAMVEMSPGGGQVPASANGGFVQAPGQGTPGAPAGTDGTESSDPSGGEETFDFDGDGNNDVAAPGPGDAGQPFGGGSVGVPGGSAGDAAPDTADDAVDDGGSSAPGGGAAPPAGGDSSGDPGTQPDDSGTQGGSGVSIGGNGGGSGGSNSSSEGGGAGSGCAASNGGGTDTGITGSEISVAATVVDDGPGASLLQPATIGMKAVLNKVNSAGGVCGRQIKLTTRNDSWDAARGREYINRFIEEGHFALLVVPSSEGLAEAIEAGDISRAKIPVVGTTGLRKTEYSEPWVFPVATATISIMRIAAKHAYDQGARSFGIVYDSKFKFGIEGKDAFTSFVKNDLKAQVKAEIPLDPDQSSYGTQAQKFNTACGNSGSTSGCDMVALLLVPETALKWRNANPGDVNGRGKETYAAQTLFTGEFARNCKDWCNAMVVWTGYQPPLPPADKAPGVQEYQQDVKRISPSIDATNQFVEGAYLGAQVFVKAVEQCSPKVTRACIRAYLDQVDFKSDLVSQLSWRPGQHHANKTAQAFAIEATGGSFNGWQYLDTGWIRDPKL